MTITVKLFAYFRDKRFIQEQQTFPPGTLVGDVVDSLKIEREEVGVLMINNKHCSFETALNSADILAIFPVIGGG